MEAGFFRREIADAAFAYQRAVDAQQKLIVGVNAYQKGMRNRWSYYRLIQPWRRSKSTALEG